MKDPELFILHMHEALVDILAFTREGQDVFMHDRRTQNAVIRSFEVLGAATKRLPQDFTARYPDIPWRTIAGFRDILIHAYDRVDLDEVWNIVEKHVPRLVERIESILEELGLDKASWDGESKQP